MKYTPEQLQAMFAPALKEVPVTTDEVLDELERELLVRFGCYPEWVKNRRITLPVACKRASCMLQAIRLLRQSMPKQDQPPTLFDKPA